MNQNKFANFLNIIRKSEFKSFDDFNKLCSAKWDTALFSQFIESNINQKEALEFSEYLEKLVENTQISDALNKIERKELNTNNYFFTPDEIIIQRTLSILDGKEDIDNVDKMIRSFWDEFYQNEKELSKE